ncbi:2Fe-2S iron-sulfur cluster-binding protein [Acanthopleuribacter pedis]|uniref:(2Fe-2S)-binding protein n=1 Tax=Acanthopleuribacter pedis TaxID=442870 RepID=A0A8J7U525_9BACT|nr:2Fe-2S iron-sulfur cluster-binding protein [Acanthopleuribacter pedis]MBO1322083.1 (2Fe-2S)-binding protein [Acanthopleuribacter pedis]
MSDTVHRIHFPATDAPDVTCAPGTNLGTLIDGRGPIEFGCFSGVCGTCIAHIRPADPQKLAEPSEAERALLAFFGEEGKETRLACRVRVHTDLEIHTV